MFISQSFYTLEIYDGALAIVLRSSEDLDDFQ